MTAARVTDYDPAAVDDDSRGNPTRVYPRSHELPSAPTIRQVAAMAGVSTATVSRVLAQSGRVSPDLDARVRAAAKALNYQPNRAARALRARQGSTVGVLIPDIQNLFFTAIVRGIDDEVQKHGFTVLLANSDGAYDRERIYLNTFRAEGVAGLLVVPSQQDERDLPRVPANGRAARRARSHGTPAQRRSGVGHQRRRLRARGGAPRRRWATGGLPWWAGSRVITSALNAGAATSQGLDAAGLPYDPTLVKDAGFEREAARRTTHDLLDMAEPPTAIFSANNTMSLGVLQAIHERGPAGTGRRVDRRASTICHGRWRRSRP